jgi:hypothetical protein
MDRHITLFQCDGPFVGEVHEVIVNSVHVDLGQIIELCVHNRKLPITLVV